MILRVLTHNAYMPANERPAAARKHARAWAALLRERDIALVCLQEFPLRNAPILAAQAATHRTIVRRGPWPGEALVVLACRERVRRWRDVAIAGDDGQFTAADVQLSRGAWLRVLHAHLDFYAPQRRAAAALRMCATLEAGAARRALACGDFNEPPAAGGVLACLGDLGLRDAWCATRCATRGATHAPSELPGTFHGFRGLAGAGVHIDAILAGPALTPRRCELVHDARFAFSDHVPLIAELEVSDA